MSTDPAPSLATSHLVAFTATSHPEQARAFYCTTLGLALVSDDEFALVLDAGGTMLRVQKVGVVEPPPYTVLGWQVDDASRVVHDLAALGVRFERYPDLPQDDQGVWTTPGGSRVAWFKDPDGNLLSLTELASS